MARKSRSRARRATSSKPSFSYACYPFSHINKHHCEDGNKIIMPASALHQLMSMQKIHYPMTFKIINPLLHKSSHCGVLEFSGEKGCVYLPKWMRDSLLLQQGQVVNIEYNELPKGTFLKVQPHSTKFIMNLSNPKEAMEKILKDFACVTIGDTIMVNHENQSYYIDVVEAKPYDAVCLFETDCELVFEKPLDYKEPEKIKPKVEQVEELKATTNLEKDAVFKPFTGVSRRVDGQVSTPLADEDDKKLVVGLRKHARTVVCGLDGNCSAVKKKAKTEETEDVMQPLDYEEPPEQIKTDEGATELKELEADFAKFKPFTGVSRNLDENISTNTTSVAKIDSNYLNEMTKLDAVIGLRNYDGTAVSGQGDTKEPPQQIKTEEGKTELKEVEADFAKFKPFTGVSRKLDENILTDTTSVAKIDSNYLNELIKLDAVIGSRNYDGTAVSGQGDNEKPPEQIKTEEGKIELKEVEEDFAKFKPFTGVSRKLDENISTNTTSVAKINSKYLNEMIKLDAVIGSRNYDGSAVSGQEDINGVGHKNEVKKFQPFTGRKYTLSGS